MSEERRSRKAVRTLLLAAITFCFLFPVLWTLSLAIKPKLILFDRPPVWIFDPVLDAYGRVLGGHQFWSALGTSAIVSIGSTLLVILIGTPAAYALARLPVRGRSDIMLFIIAGRMAPPLALIIPFFLIYKDLGLLSTHFGLILAYCTFNLSFYIWLLSVMCKELPQDLEGAGQVDGYTPFSVFWRIAVPLMRPSIIAVSVLVFLFAWNEFAFTLILGGGSVKTLPLVATQFLTPAGVLWGDLAAFASLALLPVIVLVFFLHHQIIRGLSMGAVRG